MARILHVNHRYWPVVGGSELSVAAIASRQAAAGHSVTVLTTNADDFNAFWDPKARRLSKKRERHQGVDIVRTPIGYSPGKLWGFAALRRAQTRLGKFPALAVAIGKRVPYLPGLNRDIATLGEDWDAVFDWNVTFDGLTAAAGAIAARSNCPFIVVPFLHLGESTDSRVRRNYTMPHQLALLRSADRVIVQTEIERTFLCQSAVDAHRLATIGLGIEPQQLAGGDGERFKRRFAISPTAPTCSKSDAVGAPVVTAIGPLTSDKGSQQLVEAARLVWSSGRSMKLVLAGPPMSDFERYWEIQPESVKRHVIRLGPVAGTDKNDLLAATDLLALPSRTDSFGIVLLEAWYYARPVIGARAGGIPGLIEDGEDGRLVPYGDTQALASAIIEILSDPDKAQEWGSAGKQKVMARFTWDAVYARFSEAVGLT